MKNIVLVWFSMLLFSACGVSKNNHFTNTNLFKKENLIPWSIVGFDVKERTPQERLTMLKNLGFNQYAYGYRPQHIPTMKLEWELAKKEGIAIKAVWLYINLIKDKAGNLKPESDIVFENLKAVGLKTQIWVGFDPAYYETISEEQALKETTEMINYLSNRAKKIGCKIALYNHGGWFGKPENQIKIIKSLPKYDIGIVYNFHHAHEDLANYSNNIKLLLPYLWCVNLNGMKAGGPKIMTIGSGNLETQMINQLLHLNYKGPFGILGHVKGGDPEIILQENLKGLQNLFSNTW